MQSVINVIKKEKKQQPRKKLCNRFKFYREAALEKSPRDLRSPIKGGRECQKDALEYIHKQINEWFPKLDLIPLEGWQGFLFVCCGGGWVGRIGMKDIKEPSNYDIYMSAPQDDASYNKEVKRYQVLSREQRRWRAKNNGGQDDRHSSIAIRDDKSCTGCSVTIGLLACFICLCFSCYVTINFLFLNIISCSACFT